MNALLIKIITELRKIESGAFRDLKELEACVREHFVAHGATSLPAAETAVAAAKAAWEDGLSRGFPNNDKKRLEFNLQVAQTDLDALKIAPVDPAPTPSLSHEVKVILDAFEPAPYYQGEPHDSAPAANPVNAPASDADVPGADPKPTESGGSSTGDGAVAADAEETSSDAPHGAAW